MKRKLAIATLTAAALIGTGTAVAFADGGDQKSAPVASASASPSAGEDGNDDSDDRRDDDGRDDDRRDDDVAPSGLKISAADAAVKGSAKGTVTSVDLDDDASGLVWEVTTTDKNGTEREFGVDAQSGELTERPADDDRDDRGDRRDDDGRYDDDRHDGEDRDDDRGGHGRHGGDDDRDDDGGGHGRHGGDDDRHGDDD